MEQVSTNYEVPPAALELMRAVVMTGTWCGMEVGGMLEKRIYEDSREIMSFEAFEAEVCSAIEKSPYIFYNLDYEIIWGMEENLKSPLFDAATGDRAERMTPPDDATLREWYGEYAFRRQEYVDALAKLSCRVVCPPTAGRLAGT